MRVIGEVPHPACKITIFNWNGKYLIKFEQGLIEQTYKVSEMDVSDEKDVLLLTKSPFIDKVLLRFEEMQKDLFEGLEEIY